MAIASAIERQDPEAAATAAKIHMINAAVRIKSADADFWTVELRHLARRLAQESAAGHTEEAQARRARPGKTKTQARK